MPGTTSVFGWPYPTSTDLVKDGAAAIQTLATSIDTSLRRTGCVLRRTADLNIASAGSPTQIPFGTGVSVEDLDTDNFHSFTINNARITIPAGLAGVYVICGYWRWGATGPGNEPLIILQVNGNAVVRETGRDFSFLSQAATFITYLAAGDYVTLAAQQTSGGVRVVSTTTATANEPPGPTLSVFRVGGPA